ncbi:MAG: hypothetical protein ACI83P_002046 [Janthinobacterium sp.]|jgi:hypothetical protein
MKNNAAVKAGLTDSAGPGSLQVSVHDAKSGAPMVNGAILLYLLSDDVECKDINLEQWERETRRSIIPLTYFTEASGHVFISNLKSATYVVVYDNVIPNLPKKGAVHVYARCVKVHAGCSEMVCFQLKNDYQVGLTPLTADCQESKCLTGVVGQDFIGRLTYNGDLSNDVYVVPQEGWDPTGVNRNEFIKTADKIGPMEFVVEVQHPRRSEAKVVGSAAVMARAQEDVASITIRASRMIKNHPPMPISGNVNVSMTRTETEPTPDLRLFASISASSEAMSFDHYQHFMDQLFCSHDSRLTNALASNAVGKNTTLLGKRFLPFTDTDAYRVMKVATEAFVIVNCGVFTGDDDKVLSNLAGYLNRRDLPLPGPEKYRVEVDDIQMLPYLAIIRAKLPDISINLALANNQDAVLCEGFVHEKLSNPCMLELIWSYWHEEGMQVQTMNAITRRFQNVRGPGQADPLANMEVNPLRPLNNLIWGYIQDEQHRLSVVRRNYEYDHHYGLRLDGRAVQNFRPADSRSKFIEGFHHLLRLCTVFYRQDDDTTVKADAFGVLNALKELHLIVSQGAHSQFGDLPPTARIEMLMQQWLLARPEFRDFLPTRAMVAYPEPWMDRVDAMKTLQGWTDTSVMHFHNLAVFGEQIVLAIRYGAWSMVVEPTQAFNFARFWRPQVQGYIHAYRAATGVDLSIDAGNPVAEATLPSVLLRKRLDQQARSA